MKIGIATAMGSEKALIEKLLGDEHQVALKDRSFCLGKIGRHDVVLGETGIGKVNAAIGAMEMIREFSPDFLLSSGVAGGLDSSLRVLDNVAAAEVAYHDVDCGPGNEYGQIQGLPTRFPADPRLLAHARSLRPAETSGRIVSGLVCSGDRFISKPDQLAVIKSYFPKALAVDMESGALAQVCHLQGVPFLSFRTLSDTPGAPDRFAQYTDFWDTVAHRAIDLLRLFLDTLPDSLDAIPVEAEA